MHIESRGRGPALLLLHGWGINRKIFARLGAQLAAHFTVYLVDLPGYGLSENIESYTLDNIADLLVAQMPHEVPVMGWSFGACVALKLAERHPQKIKRLVLIAATPSFIQRSGWSHAIDASVLQAFAKDLQRDYAATLKRFFALQALGSEASHEVISQLKACLDPAPQRDVLQAGLNLLLTIDLRADLARIKQPSLVIHGKQDKLVPWQAADWLASNLDDAQFFAIAKAAHAPFLSHPEKVVQAVAEFAGVQ